MDAEHRGATNITSLGTLSSLSLSGGGNVASFTNSAAVSTFTVGIASSGGACDLRTTTLMQQNLSDFELAQIGGVSAASADLLNITWNDKPSVGFTSQTHRFCFNVGNTQPYKTGYPHTFGITTTGDAICIAPNSTTAVPTSGCLYLVSDSITKMMFNTNQPYVGGLGTAPITLQNGNIYLRCSNSLNDGSTLFDSAYYYPMGLLQPLQTVRRLHSLLRKIRYRNKRAVSAIRVSASVVSTLDVRKFRTCILLKIRRACQYLSRSSVYTTSDARIKKDITEMDDSIVDGMLKVKPLLYRYKNQGDDVPLQVATKRKT
ncbi:hypothetical protein GQ600_12198 [Phytophthora cactorum]|nr:hypothetical protein GQ600_12198 [Phytophthora cactorum]